MLKNILLINFLVYATYVKSQNHEFYGILKLNGKVEDAISYKLVFEENAGKINGYSITDITGDHETKNKIEGSYDQKTKTLKFREKNIVYTKSYISDQLFCFVSFEGKIQLNGKKPKIEGDFMGFYKNQRKCIDGTLELVSSSTVRSFLEKVNKKIQKSKKLDDTIKHMYNPVQIFDSLQTNQLTKAQNLNIFYSKDQLNFQIWDNGIEDGDIINIIHNNKIILLNYTVTKTKKNISINLNEDINIFEIEMGMC